MPRQRIAAQDVRRIATAPISRPDGVRLCDRSRCRGEQDSREDAAGRHPASPAGVTILFVPADTAFVAGPPLASWRLTA
jgi:hypothetical protein